MPATPEHKWLMEESLHRQGHRIETKEPKESVYFTNMNTVVFYSKS